MRLGISSYTYVWSVGLPGYPQPSNPLTVSQLLEQAAELGVGLVQIADNLPLHRLAPADLQTLTRERANVDIEVGTRGLRPDHLQTYLELACRLRSPILRVVTDSAEFTPSEDEVVKILRSVMPDFERADVILAIENHDRFNANTLLRMIERIGSRHVGICLDTSNSIACLEAPDYLLDVLGAHVVNFHIKDIHVKRAPHLNGFVVEGTPAGQGQLDIPHLLKRVQKLNEGANAILELWPPPQATIEESIAMECTWAEQSISYLRNYLPD